MSIEALITGKLHQRAEDRISKTGHTFTVAKVRASIAEGESLFVNVLAFSEDARRALLALEAGDSLALAGTVTPKAWIDREGNPRPSLDMVAAQVLTLYGLKRKRAAASGPADHGEPVAKQSEAQQAHQQHRPEDLGPQDWPE